MRLNETKLDENRINLSKILLGMVPHQSNRNFIEVSVLTKSEWDFRQNLGWGCGIDSKESYKDWYEVQK